MAYECLDIVSIRNLCVEPVGITYWLDSTGISLVTAAKTADERFITGTNLVSEKIAEAKQDVLDYLFVNIPETTTCDLEDCICDYPKVIAKAILYRTAALIYKEIYIDSKAFNDVILYNQESAMIKMTYYDSDLWSLRTDTPDYYQKGLYQKQLTKLENIKNIIESSCKTQCVGSRYQINIP